MKYASFLSSIAPALALTLASVAPLAAQSLDCSSNGPLNLQVLHSSDNESSFQDPNTLEPKVLHYSALVEGLRSLASSEGYSTIHVTAGDHTIPGPFYRASAEIDEFGAAGAADIAFYNAMGLDANGIGNHEFDGGINEFATMLEAADYPMVSVNLDFMNVILEPGTPAIMLGADGASTGAAAGQIVKSSIVEIDGQCVGLIGRSPADFFNVIEDPDTTMPGLDFVGGRNPETNQPLQSAVPQVLEQVDLLEGMGVNKIILLDHAQDFTGDPLSAQALRGIDVIVAAGSTGFMARPVADGPFNMLRPEDSSSADYPTVRADSEEQNLLVVNSEQLYRYIGNLMISFDADGHISMVDPRSGPIATTEEAIAALGEVVGADLTASSEVQRIYDTLQGAPSIQRLFEVVGTTETPLNGQRVDVRTRETNLARLAADSTLWFTRDQFPHLNVDVALKNGGGIRDSITGPNVIRLTVQAALAFDNDLTVLRLTGEQLIAVAENSVSRVPAADGRFPQIAGMTMEFTASTPGLQAQTAVTTPSRVKTLIVHRNDGRRDDVLIEDFIARGNLNRTFVLATNSFTATGGDGYAALAEGEVLAATTTGEQEILERYIVEELGGVVSLPDPPAAPRVERIDDCVAADTRDTVIIRGCDTGVANVTTGNGCTIADNLVAECRSVSGNLGLYAACLEGVAGGFIGEADLSLSQVSAITTCALNGPTR